MEDIGAHGIEIKEQRFGLLRSEEKEDEDKRPEDIRELLSYIWRKKR